MSLKNRLKVKTNLSKKIEDEESSRGSGNRDTRFLNYFDLKTDEKMTVLFVPDANGELWTKYRRHTTPKGVSGLDAVGCSNSGCPICQKGFDILDGRKLKECSDTEAEAAKSFFAKDVMLMSVVVLDSPCDINASEDGNDLKLFNVPYNIEKIIKESLKEEMIDEDSITTTPFIIKKTENQGGRADYGSSYFARKPLTDEDFDALEEELTIIDYNFEELDVIPAVLEDDEAEAWAEKLEEKLQNRKKGGDKANTKKSVSDRLNRGKTTVSVDDEEGTDGEDGGEEEEEEQTSSRGSLRDRLRATQR